MLRTNQHDLPSLIKSLYNKESLRSILVLSAEQNIRMFKGKEVITYIQRALTISHYCSQRNREALLLSPKNEPISLDRHHRSALLLS